MIQFEKNNWFYLIYSMDKMAKKVTSVRSILDALL